MRSTPAAYSTPVLAAAALRATTLFRDRSPLSLARKRLAICGFRPPHATPSCEQTKLSALRLISPAWSPLGGPMREIANVAKIISKPAVPDGFDGIYLFGSLGDFLAGNPNQFRQAFGGPNVDFPVTSFGGFVQDHWSLSQQLTVDLGVRYDFEHLPAGSNQDTNNVSPRIGVAWSPSPKWVFRAGYGIFFDRYVLANLTRAVEKNGIQAFEQVADANVAVGIFATAQGGPLVAPVSVQPTGQRRYGILAREQPDVAR